MFQNKKLNNNMIKKKSIPEKKIVVKVIVLGSANVGKSSLIEK
jgi:GTP-binding protein EngB required for normal cell division